MKKVNREEANIYEADHRHEPAITVKQGEAFLLATEDAAGGILRTRDTKPVPENRPTHNVSPPRVNPLAGPVYIEGAEKGDIIAVKIERILPDSQGYTILQPGEGLFGDSLKFAKCAQYETHILKNSVGDSGMFSDGMCELNDSFSFPLTPFIGTLTLAPEREVPSTVHVQGPMGGNFDCREFCEGAIIYLNVYHEGGLLYAGDVHGSQGDGELSGTANEVRAEVVLSCNVIKNATIPFSRVENSKSIIALYCEKPLEHAVRGAVENMMEWITTDYGIPQRDAYLLIGTYTGFRLNIYQMVDLPGMSYTVGAELPKDILRRQ